MIEAVCEFVCLNEPLTASLPSYKGALCKCVVPPGHCCTYRPGLRLLVLSQIPPQLSTPKSS